MAKSREKDPEDPLSPRESHGLMAWSSRKIEQKRVEGTRRGKSCILPPLLVVGKLAGNWDRT